MRTKLAALATALTMMPAMAAPAMAEPVQINIGDALAGNNNYTTQVNVGVQTNEQVALFGSNYSSQQLHQSNSNATYQEAAAFSGNIFGL